MTLRVQIANPDGLAAIDGAVFVKTDDGRVAKIDPADGRVLRVRRVDTATEREHYCQGIGSDGTSLWACSASDRTTDVVRLDPKTLQVIGRVAVDKVFDQYALSVVEGRVWVLSRDGNELTRVDVATMSTTVTHLGRRCFQLAASTETVYATCLLDDAVIAVDADTGDIRDEATIVEPINVTTAGDDVWVSGAQGLFRLDRELRTRATYPGLTAGAEGDLVATDTAVWVRQPDGFVFRIDPDSGQVAAHYALHPAPSGGSLLVTDDAVWTSAANDSTVFKMTPR